MIDEAAINAIIERELSAAKQACVDWQRYHDALVFLAANGRWPTDADE